VIDPYARSRLAHDGPEEEMRGIVCERVNFDSATIPAQLAG
jgi:hypothetical protein